jgi:drug/metabolite transporter (DMT)-like permease
MRRPAFTPILVLGFGILAVSTASILIRFAQREAPSLAIAAWRLSLAAIVLAPFALTRRRAELASLSVGERGLAMLSGLFLAFHFAAWITSLEYTSVTSSVVLVTTAPLWVALLSPIVLKEPISRLMIIGMLLALIGSLLVGISDTCTISGMHLICPGMGDFLRGKAFLGDLLALTGAVFAAGYLLIGRRLRARLSLLSYIFMVYGIAALALVTSALAAGQPLMGYPPVTYLWLLALALVPQLIGHTSYNWALAYLSAAYVSISILGEPVGTSILAFFLLDEKPTILRISGAILILTGIYIASRSESRSRSFASNVKPSEAFTSPGNDSAI